MNTVLNPNYPTMAWYAQINPLGEISHLEHGSKVLVKDDFSKEYLTELNPKGLEDSNLCLGSGCYTLFRGQAYFHNTITYSRRFI